MAGYLFPEAFVILIRQPRTKTGQRPLHTICLQIFCHSTQLSLVESQDHKWSDWPHSICALWWKIWRVNLRL